MLAAALEPGELDLIEKRKKKKKKKKINFFM